MNWEDFLAAMALVLVFEGLIPFFSPRGYRNMVEQMATMSESALRMVGLVLMILGAAALFLIRG
ncbi:MAG: hypothetical protein ACI9LO_002398 [Planctomycetota bacterium]|jgi:uncharacterized protein YjeT (DUF2065 family)